MKGLIVEDAAEGEGIGPPLAIDEADEPRLKYSALSHDAPFPGVPLRLAVADKVLALGTSTGAVLILDYNGNQVWNAAAWGWRARPAGLLLGGPFPRPLDSPGCGGTAAPHASTCPGHTPGARPWPAACRCTPSRSTTPRLPSCRSTRPQSTWAPAPRTAPWW